MGSRASDVICPFHQLVTLMFNDTRLAMLSYTSTARLSTGLLLNTRDKQIASLVNIYCN